MIHGSVRRMWRSVIGSQKRALSSLSSQADLTKALQANKLISDRVAAVFEAVDRSFFASRTEETSDASNLYSLDYQPNWSHPNLLPLGNPIDHALELQLVEHRLSAGAKVLDCGCGSGFLSAVFAILVAPGGAVVGVDRDAALADVCVPRIAKSINKAVAKPSVLQQMMVLPVDGCDAVFFPKAPFDVIRVGFAFPSEQCEELENLVKQLRRGGRLIGHTLGDSRMIVVDKDRDGSVVLARADKETLFTPPVLERRVLVGGEEEGVREKEDKRKAELEDVKRQLKEWTVAFEEQHGRRPSRQDMNSDQVAASLFQRFASLNKLS